MNYLWSTNNLEALTADGYKNLIWYDFDIWKYNRFSCFENCKSFCILLKCRHYAMIIFHSRDIAKLKMFLKLFLTFCCMSNFSDIHFVAVQLLFPNISMHSNKENAYEYV